MEQIIFCGAVKRSIFRATTCGLARKTIRFLAPVTLIACLSACSPVEPAKFTAAPTDDVQENPSDRARQKIEQILDNGSRSQVSPRTTTLTEDELNQLLLVHMKEIMPQGLSDPHVRLIGNNILIARMVVDMNEYKRRRRGRGALGPLALLSGKVPVTARGVLQTQDGQGQFKLQGSEVSGVPLPPAFVREMITALSRSRRNPEGYDVEKPFSLPASIREVTINPKEAVVKQ
jgi:hypothetical protein